MVAPSRLARGAAGFERRKLGPGSFAKCGRGDDVVVPA